MLFRSLKYTDLASMADGSTVTQHIVWLFEDVLEGRLSSARAFATLHAFTNRATEHLAQQGLQLLSTPIGRELRTHTGETSHPVYLVSQLMKA